MAQKEIKRLIRTMKKNFEGSPWYGPSFRDVMEDISVRKAFSRPVENAHCMAEILCHMISWRELLNKRLQGDDSFSVTQKESFNWKRFDPDPEKAWQVLQQAITTNQEQIIASLEKSEDTLLDQKVAKRKYTYRTLITGLIEHDVYHLGQIALLKKADL